MYVLRKNALNKPILLIFFIKYNHLNKMNGLKMFGMLFENFMVTGIKSLQISYPQYKFSMEVFCVCYKVVVFFLMIQNLKFSRFYISIKISILFWKHPEHLLTQDSFILHLFMVSKYFLSAYYVAGTKGNCLKHYCSLPLYGAKWRLFVFFSVRYSSSHFPEVYSQ